jgi:hypothetical protein
MPAVIGLIHTILSLARMVALGLITTNRSPRSNPTDADPLIKPCTKFIRKIQQVSADVKGINDPGTKADGGRSGRRSFNLVHPSGIGLGLVRLVFPKTDDRGRNESMLR